MARGFGGPAYEGCGIAIGLQESVDNTLEPWVQHNSDLIPEKVEREHQHEDGKAGDNLQQGLLL